MERDFEVEVRIHTREKAVQADLEPKRLSFKPAAGGENEMFKTLRDRMNQIDHREQLFLEREFKKFSPVQKNKLSPGKGIYSQEPVYSRLNLLATHH